MTYHDHNDTKGRDARIRVAINHAERAKAAIPFEGTLYMSKYEVQARSTEARSGFVQPMTYTALMCEPFEVLR